MTQSFKLDACQYEAFHADGLLIVPGMFSPEEVDVLERVTELVLPDDPDRLDRHDAEGLTTKLSLRNVISDDVYSAIVRCERVAKTAEALLGAEVYHYHHKVMIKEPLVGGAWEWHQDYGYWYTNGCLRPDMLSCMIAISAAKLGNGSGEGTACAREQRAVRHVGSRTAVHMAEVKSNAWRAGLRRC